MGKWLDFAARLEAEAVGGDNRDNRDESPPYVPNVPFVPHSLPVALGQNLDVLAGMGAPRLAHPERWPGIVADALRLVREGWATQALCLGWEPLEIWGCCPLVDGDPAADGLAVWLEGRRVLLLDDKTCIVASGSSDRSIFTRGCAEGAVLLWDLGKAPC